MYIIDRHKDFYDHYSHIYGVDKSIVFDRRGSVIIDDFMIVTLSFDGWPLLKDDVFHILLEAGYAQYLIKLHDFILQKNSANCTVVTSCSMTLARVFEDFKHYYSSPISIRGVRVDYKWNWKKPRTYIYEGSYKEVVKPYENRVIDLPILKNTKLTSILDGQKIWIALQTYLSSLGNDRDVSIPMTDVEKAEIHGFDKKTSFRHPVK